MQISYDKEADALSIHLNADEPISRTEELDSGTLVDLDRFGGVVAIEVIHPARTWPLDEVEARFGLEADAVIVLRDMFSDASHRIPFALNEFPLLA